MSWGEYVSESSWASYRQAITAAGDGCRAAIDAERWLEDQGEGTKVATPVAAGEAVSLA